MIKQVLLITLTLAVLSCQGPKEDIVTLVKVNGKMIPEIHMSNLPDIDEVGISEIVSEFKVIPLEVKPECVIGSIMTLTINNNKIIVCTQQSFNPSPIFMFGLDGNYICEVGNRGPGPEEHSETIVRSIIVDNTILVNFQKDVQLFDADGDFIEYIRKPFNLMDNTYTYSDSIYFTIGDITGHPVYQSDSVMIVFHNNMGKIVKIIPRISYPPEDINGYSPEDWGNSIYKYDKWKMFLPGLDTLYRVENMNLIPELVLDFGGLQNDYNNIIKPQEMIGRNEFSIVGETDNYWLFRNYSITKANVREFQPNSWVTMFDSNEEFAIINKKDFSGKKVLLKDDIWGLADAKLLNRESRIISNNLLVYEMQSPDLKILISEKLKDNTIDSEIKLRLEYLDSLITEDGNPVVFLYRLKEDI